MGPQRRTAAYVGHVGRDGIDLLFLTAIPRRDASIPPPVTTSFHLALQIVLKLMYTTEQYKPHPTATYSH